MQTKYRFHHDGGHGWAEVPRVDLIEARVPSIITRCSYQGYRVPLPTQGVESPTMPVAVVFLEEDCDLTTFLAGCWQRGYGKPAFVEVYDGSNSPIRALSGFVATAEECEIVAPFLNYQEASRELATDSGWLSA